jgi:hypothetical protein
MMALLSRKPIQHLSQPHGSAEAIAHPIAIRFVLLGGVQIAANGLSEHRCDCDRWHRPGLRAHIAVAIPVLVSPEFADMFVTDLTSASEIRVQKQISSWPRSRA